MRILLMADVPPEPDSGAAGTEYRTVEALRGLGHVVDTVWAGDLPHRISHGNLHYLLELPRAYRRVMLARLAAADYDVVHVDQPHGYLAARALQGNRRCVFIHRSHGFEPRIARDLARWRREPAAGGPLRRVLRRAMAVALARHDRGIARHADGHLVSCADCRDYLVGVMGVAPERVAVIPQAPPELYARTPAPPPAPGRLKRILYVGQFAFAKAPEQTAQVVSRLAAAREDLQFTWVCHASAHESIRRLLTPAAEGRTTLQGWLPQGELLSVYDRHGIFLFPSYCEGFGKAFLEAMARGLCVVAAANGGARDVITDAVDGLLTPTGDAEAMVRAVLALVDDPGRAGAMAARAAARARAYSWERVALETVEFYERCRERKGRRGG